MNPSRTRRTTSALIMFALLAAAFVPREVSVAASKREEAWTILKSDIAEKSTDKRAQGIRVLGLLPGDAQALKLVEKATEDEKAEVRAASAIALGELRYKTSLPTLRKMLTDDEPSVALAAATALMEYKDPAAYDVYYEFLTGQRKTGKGMIASQMKTLKDPKKMAQLGIEEGIGFIPFAGIGLAAFKALRVDDASPIRAAAARRLANDPDPATGDALLAATSEKNWIIRAAALEAIAKRGDPKLLDGILALMADENTSVRCTAAAAVIRLTDVGSGRARKTPPAPPGKPNPAPGQSPAAPASPTAPPDK